MDPLGFGAGSRREGRVSTGWFLLDQRCAGCRGQAGEDQGRRQRQQGDDRKDRYLYHHYYPNCAQVGA